MQSPITERTAPSVVAKTGPGTMEYQAASTYTGGTLLYGGTILIDGAGTLGVGALNVFSGGNFEGQSAAVNSAPTVIASGATNSVFLVSANGQFKNNTNLTFNVGATWLQFIYSNSIVPSATTAALLVTNGTLTASNTVNINVLCSGLSVGQFPLVKYTTIVTNPATGFPFTLVGLSPHTAAYLSNNVANNSIDLVVTNVAQPLHWATGNGTWDINSSPNWKDNAGNVTTYQQASVGGQCFVWITHWWFFAHCRDAEGLCDSGEVKIHRLKKLHFIRQWKHRWQWQHDCVRAKHGLGSDGKLVHRRIKYQWRHFKFYGAGQSWRRCDQFRRRYIAI